MTRYENLRGLAAAICLLFIISADALAQTLSEYEKQVLEIGDRRNSGELKRYLLSTDPKVRERAIHALGNIGDTSSAGMLDFLLAGPFDDYPDESDMRAAAFALGQLPCEESRKFVRLVLDDNSPSVQNSKKFFIDAAGRIGDSTDLLRVCGFAASADTGITRATAMSIARFGLRRIKSQAAIDALRRFAATSGDIKTLQNTAFAFWRAGDRKLLTGAEAEVYSLAESEDAQTRMWGFNGLTRITDKKFLLYTMESFLSEKDWRVRVNMINMFSAFQPDTISDLGNQAITVFRSAFKDENPNVAIQALDVAGRFFPSAKNQTSFPWRDRASAAISEVILNAPENDPAIAGTAATALSLIRKDASEEELFRLFRTVGSYRAKADVLRAFGNFEDPLIYKRVRDTVTAEVARYNQMYPNNDGKMVASDDLALLYLGFVEMIASLDNKMKPEDRKTARLMLLEFSGSKDPAITANTLNALQDSIYLSDRDEIISVMKFDFNDIRNSDNYLLQTLFIDAFKSMGNKETADVIRPLANSSNYDVAAYAAEAVEALTGEKPDLNAGKYYDFDWDFIHSMSDKKKIVLKTTKGDIELELFPGVAPFTVQSFLKLAAKGYFDSTVFHRVVPNFVIQGGDITGTGFGGPDYSIRSEFSPLTYDAGIVGMASAGKDTEGSQFFITHSSAPHLDGKYTIFGHVTGGMKIVDKILVGDLLLSVEFPE